MKTQTYKQAIIDGMARLALDRRTLVFGYNLRYGSKGYGTLVGVPDNMIVEMPVAEALMAGVAIGAALTGKKPILFFERQDFMLLAIDQLINHLALIQELSHGEYNPHIIIRAVIGGTKPFNAGLQHSKRLVDMLKNRGPWELLEPESVVGVREAYKWADELRGEKTVIISEKRDLYDSTC